MIFLATYLITLPTLLIVLSLGIIFEAYDSNMSVFLGICAATIAYFMYDISLQYMLIYASAYLVLGIFWSTWRYKRHVDMIVDHVNEMKLIGGSRERELTSIELKNMVGRIVSWIVIWPFSMAENMTRDIVRLIRDLVTNVLKSVYNDILTNGKKNLK